MSLRADYSRMHRLAATLRKQADDAASIYGDVHLTATEDRSAQVNVEIANANEGRGRNPFTLASATQVHNALDGMRSLRLADVRRALLDASRVAAGILRNQARAMFRHASGQLARSISARVGP